MIRRATLAVSSLLAFLVLSDQPVSAQEREPAFGSGLSRCWQMSRAARNPAQLARWA
jgi:hypothetical protein